MDESEHNNTILIIEDDPEIGRVVSMNVSDMGFIPQIATDGRGGLDLALAGSYALIILDIMLPRLDGLEVCRKIRAEDPGTPVMMLTARADEIDRVLGLELGADDYLTKPFSVRELKARIKALIRRSRTLATTEVNNTEHNVSKIGDICINFSKRSVTLKNEELDLTVKEYDLLSLFMKNPGRAYSRTELLSLIWGYQFEGYEHTVNTHINRLRNKIEDDPANPRYLKTIWGIGYRFAETPGMYP